MSLKACFKNLTLPKYYRTIALAPNPRFVSRRAWGMYFCPGVNRPKWGDPGDNTRNLQDEGSGLLQAFDTGT
jgi:hypothetical protein